MPECWGSAVRFTLEQGEEETLDIQRSGSRICLYVILSQCFVISPYSCEFSCVFILMCISLHAFLEYNSCLNVLNCWVCACVYSKLGSAGKRNLGVSGFPEDLLTGLISTQNNLPRTEALRDSSPRVQVDILWKVSIALIQQKPCCPPPQRCCLYGTCFG